jgi:hypothetical protein
MPANNDFTEKELLRMIRRWIPREQAPKRVRIKDTADFFRVDYDDVVVLDGVPYLVRNNEREGRFGIDDEPKFWVKRARDLLNGEAKILKWAFNERFASRIGSSVFECVRSSRKEARILELVRGRPDFMQGRTVNDGAGNPLRIIDFISGRTLAQLTVEAGTKHEDYFFHHYPGLLDGFISAVEAIRFLHDHNEKHGDIRRDHLIRDSATNTFRWIDFDINYHHQRAENPFGYDLFGLGNALLYITGRGEVTAHRLRQERPEVLCRLIEDDMSLVLPNRVSNLIKVYPYIPEKLNRVLLYFSCGAHVFYDNTRELLADLGEAREELRVMGKERSHDA